MYIVYIHECSIILVVDLFSQMIYFVGVATVWGAL